MTRPLPASTALVVIDIQEKLVLAMRDESAVVGAGKLIDGARALGLRVLVTEQYPKGLGSTVPTLREKLDAFSDKPRVCEKLDFDATDDAAIAVALDAWKAEGVRTIVLAGMEAHICVAQTARGLVARGFEVLVAADATSSRAAHNERIAEGLWSASGAAVTSVEAVLFDLVRRASGDAFKAISKIVR
jgi:nicotinamidase-related amidase